MDPIGSQWIPIDSNGFQLISTYTNEPPRIMLDPKGSQCIIMDPNKSQWILMDPNESQ